MNLIQIRILMLNVVPILSHSCCQENKQSLSDIYGQLVDILDITAPYIEARDNRALDMLHVITASVSAQINQVP